MDHFSPNHQTDEGYSEEPLNDSTHDLSAALSNLTSSSQLPSWLTANVRLLPVALKTELTMALLNELPTSAIAEIVERLNPRLYIDFIQYLPAEICLKILGYLDPVSLVSVTQTCRAWYDLALDRTLWERLYYLEGWKAVRSEIQAEEAKMNAVLGDTSEHFHPANAGGGAAAKSRALHGDDHDLEMPDSDRAGENAAGGSIFGSPKSSFASSRRGLPSTGDMDIDIQGKGKGVDRSFSSTESRGKRKEPGGDVVTVVPVQSPATLLRSTLWMWDSASSRYRLNWKYLYNARRRLESNWELGKFSTFLLPHPNYPSEGHMECVYTLQFDSKYLVSGSRDRTMRIWNMQTRRLVRPPLTGHMGSVLCLQFDSDPDEDLLVSGSSDSDVFIWRFSTGELIQKITAAHKESVLNVRFDKRILVTSSKDRTIKIFNRRPLRYGDLGYREEDAVMPVPRNVKLPGYEPDLAHELPVKAPFTMIGSLEGHGAAVNAIQVRDRTIVSVSGDRHIKVWNWPDQICTQTIPAHGKGIACVEYDGRRIVSGSSDFEVCIFDAPTGLRVAQLRGHAHLVRTVQAGFGDLPYSRHEDEVEAKAVDAEFKRALEAGEIDMGQDRRSRFNRRPNAGSSRAADVQAVGAKVPPGGGGGRKYGRIVSGSYDQSIIIWRRDKEGVWKPAHTLRQEEASAAAQRRLFTGTGLRSGAHQQPRQAENTYPDGTPLPLDAIELRRGLNTTRLNMNAIDQMVSQGLDVMREALAMTPGILVYHGYLQSAIDREPNSLRRARMRQLVVDAVLAAQNAQRTGATSSSNAANASSTATPGHLQSSTSSAGAVAGSSSAQDGGGEGSGTPQPPTPQPRRLRPFNPAVPVPPVAGMVPPERIVLPGQNPVGNEQDPDELVDAPIGMQGNANGDVMVPTTAPPLDQLALPGFAGHPHIAASENGPARIFKLQFDAHKIVCCSQAPVIVGWDFCNGVAELEEVSRFFAPID